MKKFIVIIGFLVIACSSNDTVLPVVDNKTYSVSIQKLCPNGVKTNYSISKATYDRISGDIISGEVCQFVSFKDLTNNSYSGYFRSISAVN